MPNPEPGQRWGIIGGVFDPVHQGHINLATQLQQSLKLDGILFVPAFEPPHRISEPQASFDDRVAMLTLALMNHSTFRISRIEQNMRQPGYTLNTVRALRQACPDVDFSFIVGEDNLGLFKTWHQWEQLLNEIKLIVGRRPGVQANSLDQFPPDRIDVVEIELVDISSTTVRQEITKGATREQLSRLTPPRVADYIIENNLYR